MTDILVLCPRCGRRTPILASLDEWVGPRCFYCGYCPDDLLTDRIMSATKKEAEDNG